MNTPTSNPFRLFEPKLTFLVSILACQTSDAQTLTVIVKNAISDKGNIICSVFDSAENFLREPIYSSTLKIEKEGSATFRFELSAENSYAVSAVHDENSNKKLDTNLFGIPTEAVGASNNAPSRFGPPSYDDAVLILPKNGEPHTISIDLKKVF